MDEITCVDCPGDETFRVRPDGWFECPAGHELAPGDVDLDGGRMWAVDASGILGSVVQPSRSLEVIAEALDDLAASGDRSAFDTAYSACLDYVAAYEVGVA